MELLHFFAGADSNSNASWHDGPDASDENFVLRHGVDHFFAGTFGIEQKAI